MKKASLIFYYILFVFANSKSYSQTDTLNKFDLDGKKDGFWIEYFNSRLLPCKLENSVFFGYAFFDHGKKIMFVPRVRHQRKYNIEYPAPLPLEGKPILINGEFKWKTKGKKTNNTDNVIARFENGLLSYIVEFYDGHPDKPSRTIDFNPKFKNHFGEHVETLYSLSTPKVSVYRYHKMNGKWQYDRVIQ